jgi:hypothetical protein
MTAKMEFSAGCLELGTDEASVFYKGAMCQAGALALEYQFDQLFGYYKYRRVTLSIESPGGAIDGLEYVLRVMHKWAGQGRVVAVKSTFMCASAAAFLLAMGEWGSRRVDRSTFLLFHSARIQGGSQAAMTAEFSGNLSRSLHSVDRKLLDLIMDKMLMEAGGADKLADLVLARALYVETHWAELAGQLTTLTSAVDPNRKPDWLKRVQRWSRYADSSKIVMEMKKHLNSVLQRDARMDLCEAYVLCLIDQIEGVLDADSVQRAPSPVVVPQDLVPDQLQDAGAQQRPAVYRPRYAMSLHGSLATNASGCLW